MNVTIVCGAPASGKTTYVKNNMAFGDLVIDLDAIRRAICFTQDKTLVDNLLPVIMELRDHIYEMIDGGRINARHCWIIAGLPKTKDRTALAARFNAKIVFLSISEEECIRRATNDPERADKAAQAEIITKYFTTLYADRGIKPKENRDKAAVRNIALLFKDIDD